MKRLLLLLLCTTLLCAEEPPQEREELPTSFVRDIMMPVGMPLVSFFHAARESLFFNTHFSTANPLEAVGDFFLTPSRYLFAGKRIQAIQTEEGWNYEVKQHYSYRRKHWLKSLVSFATLPFSYTLGATFKGLSYLSPHVRRKHRALKRAHPIISHSLSYEQKGLPLLHCDEEIPCLSYTRPIGLTKKQRLEITALKEIAELLDTHNIPYWIDCGTCLGAYRYGGIIPWDWDIDLSIFVDDHENVKNLLSTMDPAKYQIQDWSSYTRPKTFLKLYIKETQNFIDIYHYQINEEEQTVGYLFTYLDSPFPMSWKRSELKCTKPLPYSAVFPLKKAHFDNLTVWAPSDTVTFLESKYGPHLEPTMVWNETTQTYDKVTDHPYYRNE
ncbi:MAG: hypothetical protein RLZZ453_1233 [Chlamydiota bacterium]|jgi:hypothetical protein